MLPYVNYLTGNTFDNSDVKEFHNFNASTL